MILRTFIVCFGLMMMVPSIDGHGLLIDPPSRVSAWRVNYSHLFVVEHNPKDFVYESNDMGWWCGGGPKTQMENNEECGICGDDINDSQPRASEAGGIFAFPEGKVVKTYTEGQIIEVSVDITKNHCGYFEFRLCEVTNPRVPVTQECLNQNLLQISSGSGEKFYTKPCPDGENENIGIFKVKLQLPEEFTCNHCVLQWMYVTGNSWGVCEAGTPGVDGGGGKKGCGPQEEFRACADIAIKNGDGHVKPPVVKPPVVKPPVVSPPVNPPVAPPIVPNPDGDCSSSSTGFLRDPKDCSRFYQCVPTMGGGWNKVPMSCGLGTVFNKEIPGCDWAYNVPGC